MVSVADKPVTHRIARAEAVVTMSSEAFRLVRRNRLGKGDVLAIARIAGIQAAKETSRLIPLCHPIPLDDVDVKLALVHAKRAVHIEVRASTRAATGVEMEAMTGAAVAALTVYDMCKGVDRSAAIAPVRLLAKSGGLSGSWQRPTRGQKAAAPKRAPRPARSGRRR